MKLTPDIQAAIKSLKAESKFLEDTYYPGAPDEKTRQRCEQRVNTFLEHCIELLTAGTTADALYQAAGELQNQFAEEDTEEAERVGDYIGDFMRAVDLTDWADFV